MLKFQESMLTQKSKLVQNQILHWVKPCTDVIGGKKECEIAIFNLKVKELVCNVKISR